MPIAVCLVPDDRPLADADALVAAWSSHAGIADDEMTIDLLATRQGGKRYAAKAWLYLPSLWAEDDVARLGESLAAALAGALDVSAEAVQVVTVVLEPGRVVEGGQTLRW